MGEDTTVKSSATYQQYVINTVSGMMAYTEGQRDKFLKVCVDQKKCRWQAFR